MKLIMITTIPTAKNQGPAAPTGCPTGKAGQYTTAGSRGTTLPPAPPRPAPTAAARTGRYHSQRPGWQSQAQKVLPRSAGLVRWALNAIDASQA